MPPRRARATQVAAPRPSQLEDAVFFEFVEYVGSLADDDIQQRAVKRARTDAVGATDIADVGDITNDANTANVNRAADYVPVTRRSYTFSRPSDISNKRRHRSDRARLEDAHAFFGIRFSSKSGLAFLLRRRPVPPGLRSVVFPDQEMGPLEPADRVTLAALKDSEQTASENGRFWTSVSLTVDYARNHTRLTVDIELRWNTSPQVYSDLHGVSERQRRHAVLETFFPEVLRSQPVKNRSTWSPQDFYEAAHVTNKDDRDEVYVPGLTAHLFPFQHRAVKWLLQREGVRWAPNAAQTTEADSREPSVVVPNHPPRQPEITAHFVRTEDADGQLFYVSDLFGVCTRDPAVYEDSETTLHGGILSEEMGLGKTVEIISLVLLHPRPSGSNAQRSGGLRTTGATLIVTPPALESQWVSELRQHAPHLRVMVYKGVPVPAFDEAEEADMVEQLAEHDVVITTYSALANELHFAVDPPERSMRYARKYRRVRSPLTQLSWWRVCIDEAQEIENGVSGPAKTLRTINRMNAWAITGTPVKNNVEDLWGLLLFLYYEPYASQTKVWENLLHNYQDIFRELFGRIALRHSKRAVGDELAIPPQKRYVITTPFTAVEEQHYQTLFKELTEACGLDTTGAPLFGDWDPDDPSVLESMRVALDRLRQTALHPEIGQLNRRALGNRTGPMRTVAEVLDAMIEQSGNTLLVDKRALLSQKLKRGQLLENSPRAKEALAIWQGVLDESKLLVQEARDKLAVELEKAKKAGPAGAKTSEDGKANGNNSSDSDSLDGNDDNDGEKTAHRPVAEAQRELRYALEILHKAEFFCANGYFQAKTNEDWTAPDSDEFRRLEKLETESYERAKQVRREILHESRSRAMRLMADLAGMAELQTFVSIPECAFPEATGIEGRGFAGELEHIGTILNEQAAQIDDWREAAIQLLLKDLVDDDDEDDGDKASEKDAQGKAADGGSGQVAEITGDEYEDSTKVQDEIQAYMTILKAGISDRNTLLTGQAPSELALYEERQALLMAKDGQGPAPELMLRLFRERAAALHLHGANGGDPADAIADVAVGSGIDTHSLRATIVGLREATVRLRHQAEDGSHRARMELDGVKTLMTLAQEEQTGQTKVLAGLEKESNRVRSALNARIEYYRQLQLVSDMVALYEGPKDENTIQASVQEEERLSHALATAESKHRYLLHLKETDAQAESRMCVICQSSFTTGILTVCGHQFCKECITLWFRANHNCPMCKRKLKPANLYDITLKPKEYRVASEGSAQDQKEGEGQQNEQQLVHGKKKGIYASFSTEKLDEIRNIDLPGQPFTTKVDMLVRHILWLRSSDPGAKSIVFSQYPAFLTILGQAFREHRIGFSKFADTNGIQKFREDPSVECFLLHARAHASGLNLVNASHVILCEPLLNTALELQAIARVHRIGQQNETTVWLYIVDGTVEESIYNLSVQRRMEHMGRHQLRSRDKGKRKQTASALKGPSSTSTKESTPELLDSNLELANSLELQQAQLSKLMSKGPMGGEAVAKADLWTCLFGKSEGQQGDTANDERLREDPVVRRHLAAAAAELRL